MSSGAGLDSGHSPCTFSTTKDGKSKFGPLSKRSEDVPVKSEVPVKHHSQSSDGGEEVEGTGNSRRRLFVEPLREPYPLRSGFRSPTNEQSSFSVPSDLPLESEAISGPALSPTSYPDVGRVRVTLLTPTTPFNLSPVHHQQQSGSHAGFGGVRPVPEPTPPETPEVQSPVGKKMLNLVMVKTDSSALGSSDSSATHQLVC